MKPTPTALIDSARIMPPTSQNQPQIEADLKRLAEQYAALDDEQPACVAST